MNTEDTRTKGLDVVKEARELLAKITPPPWQTFAGERCYHVASADRTFETGCIMFAGGQGSSKDNAALIARAPELLKTLCDEVDRLRGLVRHMNLPQGE